MVIQDKSFFLLGKKIKMDLKAHLEQHWVVRCQRSLSIMLGLPLSGKKCGDTRMPITGVQSRKGQQCPESVTTVSVPELFLSLEHKTLVNTCKHSMSTL